LHKKWVNKGRVFERLGHLTSFGEYQGLCPFFGFFLLFLRRKEAKDLFERFL